MQRLTLQGAPSSTEPGLCETKPAVKTRAIWILFSVISFEIIGINRINVYCGQHFANTLVWRTLLEWGLAKKQEMHQNQRTAAKAQQILCSLVVHQTSMKAIVDLYAVICSQYNKPAGPGVARALLNGC